MTGSKTKSRPGEDKTESTAALHLPDPALDGLDLSRSKLSEIRAKLASCKVIHDEGIGLNYRAFVDHLKGMTSLEVKGFRFIALRTRGSLFVLTNKSPENIYEIAPGLMSVDFRKRCILDNEGKRMYLSAITTGELGTIQSVAKQAMQLPAKFSYSGIEDFREKLALCHCDDFSCKKFAEKVKFIVRFSDEADRDYTLIIAGEDERAYRLYISPKTGINGAFHLSYGSENLYMFSDV
ncbi:hypothetical protein JXA56_04680 [Candidatus Micrarchaeota archaeon]|nr:hypothetical protein [Candidatus Micrarchaeota archaeon]